jgi:hypothetical protein
LWRFGNKRKTVTDCLQGWVFTAGGVTNGRPEATPSFGDVMKVVSQSLVDKESSYIKWTWLVDRKINRLATVYFNIDIPFNWLSKSLKK